MAGAVSVVSLSDVTPFFELLLRCMPEITRGLSSDGILNGLFANNSVRSFFVWVESREVEILGFKNGIVPSH